MTYIHMMGSQKEKREECVKNILNEIMAEKFSSLKKKTDIQVQEAQGILNKMNQNRPTIRHIIKMSNVKGKENSKGSKRKSLIQGNSLRAIS